MNIFQFMDIHPFLTFALACLMTQLIVSTLSILFNRKCNECDE